ncbi:hypothetical protein BGZ70_000142 [Mortierella alpina]|uniref:Uncharacterized protein n=1 Tax=Mortierella alpina TaxID=64518 RepID=A0A9P6LZ13_MORAP|nr:hypothetical protein BGZ70_000142 [Mortierella alpina]
MALDTKTHHFHHDHQHSNYIESPEDIFSSWSIHAPHPTMVESNNHHHNMHHEGHRTLSAEDLTAKLQRLHEEQQKHAQERSRDSHPHHQRPARGQPTFQVDPALQKRTHDAIHEILDRLERQRESNFMNAESAMPGMAENGADRLGPIHRLNPNLLMRDSSTLRQSHGNANLRHSCG